MSTLDQSLDDIISSKPRNRGIRKGRRGHLRVNRATSSRVTSRQQPTTNQVSVPAATATPDPTSVFEQGSKIIVSNLPNDVTEQQIKDLFNVQVGRVSRVSLAYGPQGISKGVATIQFSQKGDAKKAYDRYDGKLIDNSRRLKIEIIMDPGRTKPTLAARIQQTPIISVAAPRVPRGRGRGRRGTSGGRGGPSGSGRRPKKTVEELDEEMTDYFQDSGNNAAGTA